MTERPPEGIPIPVGELGWWYVEFRGANQQNATPVAPPGTSNPGGITSAQTWLNESITPGADPVFGMIDSGGTVRMFWYGGSFPRPLPTA